jgi:hypothetical protein
MWKCLIIYEVSIMAALTCINRANAGGLRSRRPTEERWARWTANGANVAPTPCSDEALARGSGNLPKRSSTGAKNRPPIAAAARKDAAFHSPAGLM